MRATDSAGNTDATPAFRSWTVDTVAPGTLTLLSPASGSNSASNKPAFDRSDVTDPSGVTYRIQVGNSGSGSPSPEVSVSGLSASNFTPSAPLAPGTYVRRVSAVDAAGMPVRGALRSRWT